jgi:predicted NBD/HSP70 family sugar kinase
MVELIREDVFSLINEYGCDKILGIGISISGMVLDHSRFIVSSSLKWKDVDLKGMLEKETDLPVFVENISLIKAVWYFCCDRSIQSDNILLVDLQNGIGASQYYDSEINRAMLGEIGHTTVEKDGEMCFCGNRGCLETMCSEQRVIRLYEEASGETGTDLRHVAQEFNRGNSVAISAVNECAKYLGIGLANLVNLCRPGAIVIDTGSFDELEVLIDKGVEEMKCRAYPALVKELEVYKVKISEEDTVRGTAFNLCDRIFDIAYPNNIIE